MVQELPKTCKIKNIISTKESEGIWVTDEIVCKISGLKTHDGLIAEVQMPEESPFPKEGNILILDCIQDPSNVGALLRSACAFQFKAAFFLNACADPFNDKALRASKGAIFKLFFQRGDWTKLKDALQGRPLFIASLEGGPVKPEKKGALLVGNEGHGPGPIPQGVEFQKVHIPISPEMESLNVAVAGGILMCQMRSA